MEGITVEHVKQIFALGGRQMSERRKAYFGIQLQHGPSGTKVSRLEIYPARLWWLRPSFREMYPNEVWDSLFRVRVDGRWWWIRSESGQRFPFYTHAEMWRVISTYAARIVGAPSRPEPLVLPPLQKGDAIIAHVDGLRTKTMLKSQPWFSGQICWAEVVGIIDPLPLNTIYPTTRRDL